MHIEPFEPAHTPSCSYTHMHTEEDVVKPAGTVEQAQAKRHFTRQGYTPTSVM